MYTLNTYKHVLHLLLIDIKNEQIEFSILSFFEFVFKINYLY